MKNDFFKAFNEIGEKYISEAANASYEESFVEEIRPVSAVKRICPAVIKSAAYLVLTGAVVFAISSVVGFGKGSLTPSSTNVSDYETEGTVHETTAILQGATVEVYTSVSDDISHTDSEENLSAKEKAREDWNSRILASPTVSELPEYYESHVDAFASRLTGWSGIFIPAPGGSEVRAISEGEVVFADYQDSNIYHSKYEYYVVIKHNDYVYTGYSGIYPEVSLKVGDTVNAGQCIGYANFDLGDKYGFCMNIGATNFAE
ncbi:MAG: M23 family metallopeptidase [Ruminiclostridium sp.]|nr:M23 family metallopeptidase [Ruminiclostridium sp.]